MTEDIKKDDMDSSSDNPSKMYSEEEVADKIQKVINQRLKNLHSEKNKLADRVKELETIVESSSVPSTEQMPPSSMAMPSQNTMDNDNSQLTANSIQEMLDNKFQEMQRNQNDEKMQAAINYSNGQVDKMKKEDPEFLKLAKEDNHLGIPPSVVAHINNNLEYKHSKKLLKELLSNENANLKMMNAVLLDRSGGNELGDNYVKWLNSIVATPSSDGKSMEAVPDLSEQSAASSNNEDYGNINSYLKNL